MQIDRSPGAESTALPPRLIKGIQAEFVPERWPGENTSGLRVFGRNVLVRMDQCASATSGGVELITEMIDRMNTASETGCIFAMGPEAYRLYEDGARWDGEKPHVGERVYVERYAGVVAMGLDGKTYRIMDQRCIAAGLNEGEVEHG